MVVVWLRCEDLTPDGPVVLDAVPFRQRFEFHGFPLNRISILGRFFSLYCPVKEIC